VPTPALTSDRFPFRWSEFHREMPRLPRDGAGLSASRVRSGHWFGRADRHLRRDGVLAGGLLIES
jgi:hypothetical protein